jgi:hypothetical protein
VNNCISIAATREVTTSLMAVSRAVLSEFPMADQMDCDLVSSASKTPSACRLKDSKMRWLWSRTNCAWRIAAVSRAPWMAASFASCWNRRISSRCAVSSAMRAWISSAR